MTKIAKMQVAGRFKGIALPCPKINPVVLRATNSKRPKQAAIGVCLALAVCAAALAGCGGSGTKTFSSPGVLYSFEYPGTWTETRNAETNGASNGLDQPSVTVAMKEPFDQATVTQYELKNPLPRGVNGNQAEVDRIVKSLTREAKGTASDAKPVKYGGVPGYQYVIHYPAGGGVKLAGKMTFLFSGAKEFQINCQSSPGNTREVNEGCDQILKSFKVKPAKT